MTYNFKDLTGVKFGRLLVVTRVENDRIGHVMWECKCDCGNKKTVRGDHLRSGAVRSCGCLNREATIQRLTGNKNTYKHGKSNTRLFKVWAGMRDRCNNPDNPRYSSYGGRGIKVCGEWESSFNSFYEWAMENGYDENARKGQCTLERINNDEGYSPNNCIFANPLEQANNRRNSRYVEYNGVKKTLAQWARFFGVARWKFYHKSDEQVKRLIEMLIDDDGDVTGNENSCTVL